jgi:glycosyl transferase family 87
MPRSGLRSAFMSSPSKTSPDFAVPGVKRNQLQEIMLGILPLLLCGQILISVALTARAFHGAADFRQLYAAGYMVRTGHGQQLYDYQAQIHYQAAVVPDEPFLPFIRPAFQALLFVPFSLVGYRAAYVMFFTVNLLFLFVSYWLFRPHLDNLARCRRWLPICLFLSFLPFSIAVVQGQDTIILLVILSLAMRMLDLRREFWAGAVLALGLFKFQIVVPIALLFLIWRRWGFFSGFCMSGTLLALISVLLTGLRQAREFVRLTWSVGGSATLLDPHQAQLRVDFMPNLRGLMNGVFATSLPSTYIQLLMIAVSAALICFLVFRWRAAPHGSEALRLGVLAAVVLSYYLLIHDLTIAVLPIALALDRSMRLPEEPSMRDRLEAWSALLALVAPVYVLFDFGHIYLLALPFLAFLMLTAPCPTR